MYFSLHLAEITTGEPNESDTGGVKALQRLHASGREGTHEYDCNA